MSLELLNTELIEKIRVERGVQLSWFVPYLGLSRTTVSLLLRDGRLPRDIKRRQKVLMRLAQWAQLNVSDLIIRTTV